VNFAVTYLARTEDEDAFVMVGEDVTERHLLQEKLQWQARHDALTGLPNRRQLLEQIDTIATTSKPGQLIGLCFADLDEFKEINDRYGHAVGDHVLTIVSERLRDSSGERDYMVARIGGDEFVIVIPPPAEQADVIWTAENILSALATPMAIGQDTLTVSMSLGLTLAAVAGRQAEALLDAADHALYQAKSGGRRQWVLQTIDSY
jgi:diguanylate cyclase (GGDEF)-like protein